MTAYEILSSSHKKLLEEAQRLIQRSRVALAEEPPARMTTEKHTTQRKSKVEMSTEVTAAKAGELYASNMSVMEVATTLNITYSKARRLIQDSGTPIRDASTRLKGRTRKSNS